MVEKAKVDIYIAYLEQILAGEKDIGLVEDEEIEKLLLLAKTMIATDLSVSSKIRENLRKQLLDQVIKKSTLAMMLRNDDELDEEDLNLVAAGFEGQTGEENVTCPFCGSRSKKLQGKCPNCSR
ncbi:MAG: hypothetical protein K0R09_512 [Clostridiales bacterium]|jgi:hypothetical protein|nr:hypothetical protein [Clostridiales bacterium]